MMTPLDDSALDTIFRKARTQNKWFDKPVSREQLVALYDLMRWGPTSANCFPVRIVFVTTPAAKERLKPLVLEGNRDSRRRFERCSSERRRGGSASRSILMLPSLTARPPPTRPSNRQHSSG